MFVICFLIEKLQRALTEAGVSSVDELKESIEKTTASIRRLQSKVSCDEEDDPLKSVSKHCFGIANFSLQKACIVDSVS
jgi:hypothetical protein